MKYKKKRLKSIKRYSLVAQRCQKIIDLWNGLKVDNCYRGKWDSDELIRYVIVLKIASMDTFFTDKFMEMFIPFIKKNGITDGLELVIKKTSITLKESLNFLTQKEPLETLFYKMRNEIRRYVAQDQKRIDFLFKGFGIDSISFAAEEYDNTGAGKKDDLLRRVRVLVRRRHSIVHDGDMMIQAGLAKKIGWGTISKIETIDRYVTACEYLLNKQIER